MRLYLDSIESFVKDTVSDRICALLKTGFLSYFGCNPSTPELNSWRNSLKSLCNVIQMAKLTDNYIMLEYQLPQSSKRLDVMITGADESDKDSAVIVELKQWEQATEANGENEVITYVGHGNREVLHPSVQVGQYQTYLMDMNEAFYEKEPVKLASCAYLHNYHFFKEDELLKPKFANYLNKYPLYSADNYEHLIDFLVKRIAKGRGEQTMDRVLNSAFRPSKKLMEHITQTIQGLPNYILLDEQLVVYDEIFAYINKGMHQKDKKIFIVKGGPGTGKSVVALNLMADLLRKDYSTYYTTGSKAFTETLRKIVGTRASGCFKYFNSFSNSKPNDIDIMICDEAHRIRETSNNMYTPQANRSNLAQIEELFNAAKTSVYFIDDKQVVRPNEIGSVEYIKTFAKKYNYKVKEFELETQFRCQGSEDYIKWINYTLEIEKNDTPIWKASNDKFDFQIVSSPTKLEEMLQAKIDQGNSARMTAGFCWPWSKGLDSNQQLVKDVVVGDYQRPWNATPDAVNLPKNIPKASFWAYDPNGFAQVGCIYTAQGFEFDYVGVIFGKDLRYDFENSKWVGSPAESHDSIVKRAKGQFLELVKSTYRVLLTRGMKGCYVYFVDKETEHFFKSRLES